MRLFFFTIFLLVSLSGIAQFRTDPHQVWYDSTDARPRGFSESALSSYRNDADFQYERYKEPPASMWDRFWQWFWQKIGDVLDTKGGAITFRTVFIILALLGIGFFIYRISGMSKTGMFSRNSGDVSGYSVHDEDIHSINFEKAVADAIANGDYRLAVRLLYLQSLKILADSNRINWQLNKTNIAYINELQGRSYQSTFSELTLQFENNWYGDRPIDAGQFSNVQEQFRQFNRQII